MVVLKVTFKTWWLDFQGYVYIHIYYIHTTPILPCAVWNQFCWYSCQFLHQCWLFVSWKSGFLLGNGFTPWKINMEHNHGGLEDHFPF